MKKTIILIGIISIMTLMISTATAVPTINSKTISEKTNNLDKIKMKFEELLNIVKEDPNILLTPFGIALGLILIIIGIIVFGFGFFLDLVGIGPWPYIIMGLGGLLVVLGIGIAIAL